jgi:hypothetical protein
MLISAVHADATYTTRSATGSSEWLILEDSAAPHGVTASDTGTLPQFSSGSALNQTKIGTFCSSFGAHGTCLAFTAYTQTGWYFDSAHGLLFIHYLGGPSVDVTIIGQTAIVASTTSQRSSTTGGGCSVNCGTTTTTKSTPSNGSPFPLASLVAVALGITVVALAFAMGRKKG